VTLRNTTERPETIEVGANVLVGTGCYRIRGGEREGKRAAGVGKSFCGWQRKCQDSGEYFGDEVLGGGGAMIMESQRVLVTGGAGVCRTGRIVILRRTLIYLVLLQV